jgi:hypothetical protein
MHMTGEATMYSFRRSRFIRSKQRQALSCSLKNTWISSKGGVLASLAPDGTRSIFVREMCSGGSNKIALPERMRHIVRLWPADSGTAMVAQILSQGLPELWLWGSAAASSTEAQQVAPNAIPCSPAGSGELLEIQEKK